MKKILLTALFYLFVANGFSQAFVTTWNTGTDNYIIIPGYGTNYNIAWEEIGNPSHNGSKIATDLDTVFFGNSGSYKVSIGGGSPAFNRISFDTLSLYSYFQRQRLLTVESWGNIVWQTMTYAFSRCTLLTTVPITPPNLSLTTDLSYMFYGCGSFNSDISNWNTGNITNMGSMFCYASSFNQSLNNWNTSKVTNMGNMFGFANSFNQPLNNWNISNVTNMSNMFDNADVFNQPIGNWNTGNVTNMSSMFSISYFNQPLNNWNTNNVTNI